jgi:hypothetical protein
MTPEFDEYGVLIRRRQPAQQQQQQPPTEVDEFGIPIKKKEVAPSAGFPLLYERGKTTSIPAVSPSRRQLRSQEEKIQPIDPEFAKNFKIKKTAATDKDIEDDVFVAAQGAISSHTGGDPLGEILKSDLNVEYLTEQGLPDYRASAKALTKKLEILDNAFESGTAAKNLLQREVFGRDLDTMPMEEVRKIAGNNVTKNYAANRYEKLRNVKTALKDSRTLEEAAVRYAATTDENVKYLLDKAGGLMGGFTDETSAVPMNVRGEKTLQFLMNPDVQQIAQQDENLRRKMGEEIANFPLRHPEYATRLLADAISKRRDEKRDNNWFVNIVGKENTDKIVDELIAEGSFPISYRKHYETTIRPKLGTAQSIGRGLGNLIPGINQLVNESPISTPGLLENLEQGAEQAQVGIAKSISGLTGITGRVQSDAQQQFLALRKQYDTPQYEPKKLLHQATMHGGQMIPFVVSLMGGTNALRATQLIKNPTIANATMMALATHGESQEKARTLFPGDKMKQFVYTGTMDALNGAMGRFLPGQKIPKLLASSENTVANTLKKMVDGEITTQAAKNQIVDWFANTAKSTLSGAEFMGAISAADDALTQLLQGKGIDFGQSLEAGWEGFKLGMIATPFLAGAEASLKTNRGFRDQILSIAENPEYYKQIAEYEAQNNPEFAKIKEDVMANIDYVSRVSKELEQYNLSEKEQKNWVLNSLTELIKKTKAEETTDPTIKKRLQQEAKDMAEIKQGVLNGIPEEKIRLNQISREVKTMYDSGYLPDSLKERLESKKSEEGEPKFDEGKVKSFLKEVAETQDKKAPKRVLELANEMFPKEEETLKPIPIEEEKVSISARGKKFADKIRSLKVKQKRDVLQSNIFGVGESLYNTSLDIVAYALENGAKLADAINRGVEYIKTNYGESLNEAEYRKSIEDIAGQRIGSRDELTAELNYIDEYYGNRGKGPNPGGWRRVDFINAIANSDLSNAEIVDAIKRSNIHPTDKKKITQTIEERGKKVAAKIRELKSQRDRAQANLLGIPVAIYDGIIETIATLVENGAKLTDAIQRAVKSIPAKEKVKIDEEKLKEQLEEIETEVKTEEEEAERKVSVILPGEKKVDQENIITISPKEPPKETKPKISIILPKGKEAVKESETITIKSEKDAIPEQSADEMDVRQPSGDGGKMGEGNAKSEIPPGKEEGSKTEGEEGEMIRLAHADTERIYEELNAAGRLETPTKGREQLEKEANEQLEKGYDFNKVADEVMGGKYKFNDVDQFNFARKVADLKAKLNNTPIESPDFDRIQNEIEKLSRASDVAGTEMGRALQSRKTYVPVEETLSDYITRQKAESGVETLTEHQKEINKKEFDEISKKEKAYQDKLRLLEEENNRLKAEAEIKKAAAAKKKTEKKDYKKEREDIVNSIREKLKKSRGEMSSLGPLKDLVVIAPDVAKLVKSYVEQGITELSQVVKKIHGDLKDDIDGITEKDIQDIIAGKYKEKKKTRNELAEKLFDLKREAYYVSKLEALLRGEEPKSEKKKIERNKNIAELKQKIKSIQDAKRDAEREADRLERDFEKEQRAAEKARLKAAAEEARRVARELSAGTPEEKVLNRMKEAMRKKIKEIEYQLKTGDYDALDRPKKEPIPLDKEALKLRDELIAAKQKREVRLALDARMNETKMQRARRLAIESFNVPRTLMTIADFSGLLRQNLFFSAGHPIMTSKALPGMFKSFTSQKVYDRWFADLKEMPRYETMKESKLSIADAFSHDLSAREEAFMSSLAEKLPIVGNMKVKGVPVGFNIVKGSERSYTLLLNKMRVDMFNYFADKMEARGMTFKNSPAEYKALAEYINNATGRGSLGETLNKIAPLLNSIFFSPRLISSRLNMLTYWAQPRFWKTLPREARIDYARNWISLLGVGMTILGLAKLGGADVEDDPRSSDFGKIKAGNTRWDIWGGAQQYIRVVAQIVSGKRKSTSTGGLYTLDKDNAQFKDTKLGIGFNFLRGKLAPVPGAAVDIFTGKTANGDKIMYEWTTDGNKEVSIKDYVLERVIPMTITGTKEAIDDQGLSALLTVGVPSTFGIGTQTYKEQQPAQSKRAKKHRKLD